ncbi:transcriptional regulator [Pseudomonas alloputida]|nr:transcriptional regulator [Pseudomonas aeruginosa]TRZ57689.1 transcriptional regulator [Pseudomonas alloputida]
MIHFQAAALGIPGQRVAILSGSRGGGMAKQDEMTNRSIAILINLSAGLDEAGIECGDERVPITANLRLAAAAGAAALSQRAKRSTPFSNQTNSPHVKLVKTAANWLDQLKVVKGFHGDVSAAEFLGVSQTQFSRWRTGKDLLDNYHAWQIAAALSVNPMVVIGSVGFHHSRDTDRTRWLAMLSTVLDSELPAAPMQLAQAPAREAEPVQQPAKASRTASGSTESTAQGSKWTDDEDQRLIAGYRNGEAIDALATAHKRTPKAILLRLSKMHRLIPAEQLASLCELYGVNLSSSGNGRKTEQNKSSPRPRRGKAKAHAPTVFL